MYPLDQRQGYPSSAKLLSGIASRTKRKNCRNLSIVFFRYFSQVAMLQEISYIACNYHQCYYAGKRFLLPSPKLKD